MTTINSKIIVRRGNYIDMPKLDVGELGFAKDQGVLYCGNEYNLAFVSADSSSVTLRIDSVDLDNQNGNFFVEINNDSNLIAGTSVTVNDNEIIVPVTQTFDASDTFVLFHNAPVNADMLPESGDIVQRTSFTKTQPVNTPQITTVDFISFNNDLRTSEISYMLKTADGFYRTGVIEVSVCGSDDTHTTITDTYKQTTNINLVFTVQHDIGNKFNLMFDTTETGEIQFSYTQRSYDHVTVS